MQHCSRLRFRSYSTCCQTWLKSVATEMEPSTDAVAQVLQSTAGDQSTVTTWFLWLPTQRTLVKLPFSSLYTIPEVGAHVKICSLSAPREKSFPTGRNPDGPMQPAWRGKSATLWPVLYTFHCLRVPSAPIEKHVVSSLLNCTEKTSDSWATQFAMHSWVLTSKRHILPPDVPHNSSWPLWLNTQQFTDELHLRCPWSCLLFKSHRSSFPGAGAVVTMEDSEWSELTTTGSTGLHARQATLCSLRTDADSGTISKRALRSLVSYNRRFPCLSP